MMKRSQIIIICTVVLAITWMLIIGWLQANAYNVIKSGRTCNYAKVNDEENTKQFKSFKYIYVDADKLVITPKLYIKPGDRYEISFSNSMKNAVSTRISGDTLYLKIIRKTYGMSGYINIYLPLLNSVNIKTTHDSTLTFSNSGVEVNISDFKCNSLYVNNNGKNNLNLYRNKLKKLVIKGNFYNKRDIQFSEFTECDSLDVDIDGQNGSLILGSGLSKMKINPNQWTSIRLPESYRVEANAVIASKIILKK